MGEEINIQASDRKMDEVRSTNMAVCSQPWFHYLSAGEAVDEER